MTRTHLFWLLQGAGWGLYFGVYYLSVRAYHPFGDIALHQTLFSAGVGLATSAVLRMVLRRLRQQRWPAVGMLSATVGFAVFWAMGWHGISMWGHELLDPFRGTITGALPAAVWSPLQHPAAYLAVAFAWTLAYTGIVRWERERAQNEQVLQADAAAQRARLQMLRYQINPHFLFNVLGSVRALVDEDAARTKQMINELSGFLRYSLLDIESQTVALRQEVEAVEHYLAVEQIRFEHDLVATVAMDPAATDHPIPAFLVLPLVENAIKYGQQTSPRPLQVTVRVRRSAAALHIDVSNTGTWIPRAESPALPGKGFANVRQRLALTYPDRHHFTTDTQDGWVHVRIALYDHP
ncbi:MAG: histidine kinase [Bacteroidota bacterium]